jgi:hypothetical protein
MFLLAENDIFVALVIKIVFMLRHEYSPDFFFFLHRLYFFYETFCANIKCSDVWKIFFQLFNISIKYILCIFYYRCIYVLQLWQKYQLHV